MLLGVITWEVMNDLTKCWGPEHGMTSMSRKPVSPDADDEMLTYGSCKGLNNRKHP